MYPEKNNMYRMPWSLNDNPIGWLEVTDICNIHCKGCYRLRMDGHKPLEQLKEEVLFLRKWRNCDGISLAGGEALLHPNIVDLVKFITANNMKPMILTNGVCVTEEILRDSKKAGLIGVGFHVDSFQNRPGWEGKNEKELCELRYKFADTIAKIGGMFASFGATIYQENAHYVPDIIQWAIDNIKIASGLTFMTYRGVPVEGVEWYVKGQKVDISSDSLGYTTDETERIGITSKDLYALIKKHYPDYDTQAYLGGTADHTSLKWLIGNMLVGSKGKTFGAFGKKTMELAQTLYHLFNGTYLVYTKKANFGRKIFMLSAFDKTMRKAFKKYLKYVAVNPFRFFYSINNLSIGIVQAPDMLADGRSDMCDSCPDVCVFEGKLVNSCRLDEYRKYGGMLEPKYLNEEALKAVTARDKVKNFDITIKDSQKKDGDNQEEVEEIAV